MYELCSLNVPMSSAMRRNGMLCGTSHKRGGCRRPRMQEAGCRRVAANCRQRICRPIGVYVLAAGSRAGSRPVRESERPVSPRVLKTPRVAAADTQDDPGLGFCVVAAWRPIVTWVWHSPACRRDDASRIGAAANSPSVRRCGREPGGDRVGVEACRLNAGSSVELVASAPVKEVSSPLQKVPTGEVDGLPFL